MWGEISVKQGCLKARVSNAPISGADEYRDLFPSRRVNPKSLSVQ